MYQVGYLKLVYLDSGNLDVFCHLLYRPPLQGPDYLTPTPRLLTLINILYYSADHRVVLRQLFDVVTTSGWSFWFTVLCRYSTILTRFAIDRYLVKCQCRNAPWTRNKSTIRKKQEFWELHNSKWQEPRTLALICRYARLILDVDLFLAYTFHNPLWLFFFWTYCRHQSYWLCISCEEFVETKFKTIKLLNNCLV